MAHLLHNIIIIVVYARTEGKGGGGRKTERERGREGRGLGRGREREREERGREREGKVGTVWSLHEWLTLLHVHACSLFKWKYMYFFLSTNQLVIFSWEPPIIYNSRGHLQSTYTLPSRPFINSHHSLECASLGCLEGKNWRLLHHKKRGSYSKQHMV